MYIAGGTQAASRSEYVLPCTVRHRLHFSCPLQLLRNCCESVSLVAGRSGTVMKIGSLPDFCCYSHCTSSYCLLPPPVSTSSYCLLHMKRIKSADRCRASARALSTITPLLSVQHKQTATTKLLHPLGTCRLMRAPTNHQTIPQRLSSPRYRRQHENVGPPNRMPCAHAVFQCCSSKRPGQALAGRRTFIRVCSLPHPHPLLIKKATRKHKHYK
jgi:hypothetical protein